MAQYRVYAIFACFFFSGAAGLMYEVVWAKYMALLVGGTAYAHALVLAVFMGGLAVGNAFLGRRVDRSSSPLRLFAWFEFGITVWGVSSHYLFMVARDFLTGSARQGGWPALFFYSTACAAGVLIMAPATILMGGTLPALSKWLIRAFAARGQCVARLYAVNSIGAVVGTGLAGFLFIRAMGLAATVTLAAMLNFFSALISRTVCAREESAAGPENSPAGVSAAPPAGYVNSRRVTAVIAGGIFLSGFTAMSYELVWTRLLSMIFGSSTYAFSLMLMAFISGISIGAAVMSRYMPPESRTLSWFAWIQAAIAVCVALTVPCYGLLPLLFFKIRALLSPVAGAMPWYFGAMFLFCFILMLVPTILLGMTLPLASRCAIDDLRVAGRRIGNVFAANTAGNICGALFCGLLLIPTAGLRAALNMGIVINAATAVAVFVAVRVGVPNKTSVRCGVALAAGAIGFTMIVPAWDPAAFALQPFRARGFVDGRAAFEQAKRSSRVIFAKDGATATVVVTESPAGERALLINGKPDASTRGDLPSQILFGQIPLLIKDTAAQVLVIGFGSGITAGSVLRHPVAAVDVVEISPEVLEAGRLFAAANHDVLQDPRLQAHIEDAKIYLQRTAKKYDVIVAEPSNPWMSGVADLFSEEFFLECRRHLREGGIMAQWVQGYELTDATFEVIMRTFLQCFPEVSVWNTGINDYLLFGSEQPLSLDVAALTARMAAEPVRQELARVQMEGVPALLTLQMAGNDFTRKMVWEKGVTNSLYYPTLEFDAPLGLFLGAVPQIIVRRLDERRLPLEKAGLYLSAYLRQQPLSSDDCRRMVAHLTADINRATANVEVYRSLILHWCGIDPDNIQAQYARAKYFVEHVENSLPFWEEIARGPLTDSQLKEYAEVAVRRYEEIHSLFYPEAFSRIMQILQECAQRSERDTGDYFRQMAVAALSMGDADSAAAYFEQAAAAPPDPAAQPRERIAVWEFAVQSFLRYGEFARAVQYAEKIRRLDPANTVARLVFDYAAVQRQP
ncbi:MAG: fused MFS/spermidine synthase [Candidatus Omnitrophica bacterium]|nr:fused MFS/spermidine synthase [Candidatus Omnitrophota bacterium]